MDLGATYDVFALQLNLAEHNTKLMGRQKNSFHRYLIEYSTDGSTWTMLVDKSKNEEDNTHPYFQLPGKVSCRYLRIKNIQVPDGNFAISDFRVFGKGKGSTPEKVNQLEVQRNPTNRRSVNLSWSKSQHATGYVISYGVDKKKLYQNYMVYQDTALSINSLDASQKYYFSIEAFNENGRTISEKITEVK
ncbi:F5/8 type C domain protein [compost metagenome]